MFINKRKARNIGIPGFLHLNAFNLICPFYTLCGIESMASRDGYWYNSFISIPCLMKTLCYFALNIQRVPINI